ncbi:CPBP family intramembrane glutamic endopeptidase [Neobacillus sp. PS2-9]|uniref:CPBP family intramembrane glutamic endopeptidase n=1 Tax=Neobacillus sp. PS2-9 TaxID=3070676 RepID=UPI0027DECF2E|nr:CPBP family intramembrane glutamic endopeptidase [Neobacillus sp. PS2-9]WML58707.1 CPBP family intramembrane glutamic endopeptidase [Neobacillus sp. PS2-9]
MKRKEIIMTKESKWKTLVTPLTLDIYSRNDILAGLGITTFAMFGIFLVSKICGLLDITNFDLNLQTLVYYTGLIFISAGYEELVFRCILLTILVKLFKKPWFAILITSIYFGYVHYDNDHATLLSAFSNGLGGVMYGLAFIYTRKIWFPWALHFAWNYVQAPILGFPVSGFKVEGILKLNLLDHSWLSGGLYGPEGGIVGISFRFVVIMLIVIWIRTTRVNKKESANYLQVSS